MRRRYSLALVLITLFFASVAVRAPLLNRPLSKHNEFVTAVTLRHLQIWYEDGALKHRFVPPMSYPGANKYINNNARQLGKSGNYYYTSYPPLAYIVPFLIFKLLGLYPNVLGLQLLNLTTHLVTVVLIYLIIERLTAARERSASLPAMIGATVYLFAPGPLWFHANTYQVDMFIQPLFAAAVYFWLRSRAGNSRLWPVAMTGTVFAMVYTEWLGIFFALTLLILSLFDGIRGAAGRLPYLPAAVGSALGLTLWQYSSVGGSGKFVEYAVGRFIARSGSTAAEGGYSFGSIEAWEWIGAHYWASWGEWLIFLTVLIIWSRFVPARAIDRQDAARTKVQVFVLLGAPVLLHHLLLFSFSAIHEFAVLKTGLLLAIGTGLLVSQIVREKKVRVFAPIIALSVLLIFVSVGRFWAINRVGNDIYLRLGTKIAAIARPDEVVFLKPGRPIGIPPQLVFYAHRNLAVWRGQADADRLVKLNSVSRGVVIELSTRNNEIISAKRFQLTE